MKIPALVVFQAAGKLWTMLNTQCGMLSGGSGGGNAPIWPQGGGLVLQKVDLPPRGLQWVCVAPHAECCGVSSGRVGF